jgi:RimJ/RimL family protein N-acetyltransferase
MADPELRTPRSLLRPWRADDPSDVEAAYDIYRRPEVSRWLGTNPAPWPHLAAAQARLERWAAVSVETPGYGLWAVVPDDVGRPVGTALLVHLPAADSTLSLDVEIGWHFHPDVWGHGYATESARALLEHGFTTLDLTRINAVAYDGNEPSFAVMRRLGMQPQGPTDRWYATTMQWWSLDRDQWEQQRHTLGTAGVPR